MLFPTPLSPPNAVTCFVSCLIVLVPSCVPEVADLFHIAKVPVLNLGRLLVLAICFLSSLATQTGGSATSDAFPSSSMVAFFLSDLSLATLSLVVGTSCSAA